MAVVSMKALLETGVHFGHRTRKWNPRMKSYIFTERNGIHIIDLQQTLEALEEAYGVIRDIVAEGGSILFVGTKRQAQETIELEAVRCGMPYVNLRWLGGTLTNWMTIRSRIDELEGLERRRDAGELELLTKKEALTITRRIDKLEARLGGIREMRTVPKGLFAVDVRQESTSIHEANLLNIPVIALVDTNCDPSVIDYVIPSNDDAIRAIKLLTSKVADAVLEGKAMRKDEEEEQVTDAGKALSVEGHEMSDEELLGEATLAKIQSGAFGEKEKGEEEPEKEEGSEEKDTSEEPETTDEVETVKDAETGEEPETKEEPETTEDPEVTEEPETADEPEVTEDTETAEELEADEAEDTGDEEKTEE
ncbi:MAG: 30S ribosomal protein S2 [Anaerolineales bacterium]|nr:30S ribosomal protein S2 [Anaerolineales bacterium]